MISSKMTYILFILFSLFAASVKGRTVNTGTAANNFSVEILLNKHLEMPITADMLPTDFKSAFKLEGKTFEWGMDLNYLAKTIAIKNRVSKYRDCAGDGYNKKEDIRLGCGMHLLKEVDKGPQIFIDSTDIESIAILKDADATSIYGTRERNGAILTSTKKGNYCTTRSDSYHQLVATYFTTSIIINLTAKTVKNTYLVNRVQRK